MTLAQLYCVAQGFDPDDDGVGHRASRDYMLPAAQPETADLQQLIIAIQRGDETAFERLFRFFYRRIVRYVAAIVHDREIAEDVVQTVFVRLWERRGDWTVRTTVDAYLVRAARNQAIDAMRRHQREHRWEDLSDEAPAGARPSATAATDRDAEQQDLIRRVNRALGRLSTQYREILALKWGGQYSHAEIAEITGQPVRTVETQVARAVKALRNSLGVTID